MRNVCATRASSISKTCSPPCRICTGPAARRARAISRLRGIGEREQYEGAPNPSVGFLIDDIDFSGIGMAATLFDVDRSRSAARPAGHALRRQCAGGTDRHAQRRALTDEFGLVDRSVVRRVRQRNRSAPSSTGPVAALDSAWRLAVQRYRSDGFRDDPYLSRDDTNDRDELTARAKWRWQPSERRRSISPGCTPISTTATTRWSIDNSRRSLADRPGKDSQQRRWRRAACEATPLRSIGELDGDRGGGGVRRRIQLRWRLG